MPMSKAPLRDPLVMSLVAPYCALPRDFLSDTPLSRATIGPKMITLHNFIVSNQSPQ